MAYKLVIEKDKVVNLIKLIQTTYKTKGFTTVKDVSPIELIKKSELPHTGIVASNIFDWLVKKGYLQKTGGRGRAILGYKWVDTLYDHETVSARYIQFINTLTDNKAPVTKFNPGVKPSQFNLNDDVYFIDENKINHGSIKGIFLVRRNPTELDTIKYQVLPFNHGPIEVHHDDVFPSIDLLLMHLKSEYEKKH